ncbi:hypothetical protein HID58_083372, partial [Brassica napus]
GVYLSLLVSINRCLEVKRKRRTSITVFSFSRKEKQQTCPMYCRKLHSFLHTTFSDEEDINLPTEMSARREDNFKWNPNRERVFIELYDRAISMSDYRFKDPTSAGKEFVVAKFNQMYNISVNYRFFKEKLDQLKRKYKKYKHLMKNSTGILVDPTTSVISASDSWWKDREVDRIVKSFKRKPPELWDVMQRCFVLYDVQSQSQYSLHQRREELLNDGQNNDETETYGGDMQDTQVQETQESEEIPTSRVQQRSGLRRGSSSQRGAGTSRITARSGSQGSRRKQSFETTLTDTMMGFREFQRQSLQQLRPNSFDEDDYNEFDNAACIHAFKEERFWRNTQQWGPTSAVPQWGSSPTTHQWGSSQDAPQYIPPRNVQHGFSLETEVQTTTREKEVPVSENVIRGVSPEFTNYASTSKASRPRRRGGLFNIWGTERGLNLNETQENAAFIVIEN